MGCGHLPPANHLLGVNEIDYIWVANDADAIRAVSGFVYLIGITPLKFGTAGNSLPKSTLPRGLNELVTLKHDPKLGKWIDL